MDNRKETHDRGGGVSLVDKLLHERPFVQSVGRVEKGGGRREVSFALIQMFSLRQSAPRMIRMLETKKIKPEEDPVYICVNTHDGSLVPRSSS